MLAGMTEEANSLIVLYCAKPEVTREVNTSRHVTVPVGGPVQVWLAGHKHSYGTLTIGKIPIQ